MMGVNLTSRLEPLCYPKGAHSHHTRTCQTIDLIGKDSDVPLGFSLWLSVSRDEKRALTQSRKAAQIISLPQAGFSYTCRRLSPGMVWAGRCQEM